MLMMNDVAARRAAPPLGQFQLETLEGLPCGCVVAVQSVRPSDVMVVSLEAKGPHCTHRGHRTNKVIRLGEGLDGVGYDAGDEFSL